MPVVRQNVTHNMNEGFILCRPSQLEDFPTFQFFNGGCSRHANRARAPRSERTKEFAVSRAPICLATLLLHNDDVALRVAGVTEGCFQVGSERQLADRLACPSPVPDAFDPRGSSARILS